MSATAEDFLYEGRIRSATLTLAHGRRTATPPRELQAEEMERLRDTIRRLGSGWKSGVEGDVEDLLRS